MSLLLNKNTPALSAVDPRGLAVRVVAYHRAVAGEAAQARVTQAVRDGAGRVVAQRDPRLFALAEQNLLSPVNLRSVYSLSAQVLVRDSADAGVQISLVGEAGQVVHAWDGAGGPQRWIAYDDQLRPQAVHEQSPGQAVRCVERFTHAGSDPDEAAHNRCGRLIRHDDPAGTRTWPDYGLTGMALRETQQFLATLDPPDWPDAPAERDALLETEVYPTDGAYDVLGTVLAQTDARGHRQAFAYTVAGSLRQATLTLAHGPVQVLLHALDYNAQGQLLTQTAGNGVVTMNIYDSANGRLRRSTATRQDRQALQDREYVYDPVGNVTQVQDRAIPVRYFRNRAIAAIDRYGYDSLGQLIQASGRESASAQIGPALPVLAPLPGTGEALSPYTQTYTYDAGGNLTQLHHQGAQVYTRTTAVARHSNRALVQVGDTPPDVEAGFDAHGNLLRLSPGGQALAWDGRQQLRQVTTLARADGSDDTEVYVYGGGGQRLRKVSQAQAQAVTHHHEVRYLPGLELHTRSGDEQWEVVIASGTRVLHWRAGRPPELPNDAFRYTLSDHLGSTVLELDADAALISAEGYYPYGSTAWWAGRHQVEASYKTIRYSGKERDATGLYYYGFRYYATWLQRWLNPDPAGEVDGLNLFRMAKNNPINFLDRSGLNGVDWLDLATGNVDDASIVAALYRAHPGLKERYGLFTGATSTIIKQAEVNTREINSTRSNAKQRKLAESFRFTEKKLQGYAAHAGVSAADGGAASYQSEFVNFPGGLSPKQLFPGVSIQQNKIKAGFEPYVPKSPPVSRQNSREESAPIREGVLSALEPGIGSYKIVDVDKFIGGVREKYQSEGRPLHSVTEHRIRKHIERNNFVLPIRAGIAGLHAEVQAFNAWVSAAESLPTKTEAPYYKLISESYIFTQRLVGDRGRDFPACHNCSGILSAPVNIMTGRVTNAAHTHTRTRRMST